MDSYWAEIQSSIYLRVGVRYIYDTQSLSRNISNLKEKANYSRYEELESTNKTLLKKFIDYNRFSLAIKSKLYNDRESFHYFKSKIDLKPPFSQTCTTFFTIMDVEFLHLDKEWVDEVRNHSFGFC